MRTRVRALWALAQSTRLRAMGEAPREAIAYYQPLYFQDQSCLSGFFFEKLFFLNHVLGKNPLR